MPINHVRRFVLIGVLLAAAIILSACDSNSTPSPRTPKAVFIIVDGIPADVIERVETPNLDAISLAGAYTRAYVGGQPGTASETPTISAPGYMCLITGTWANKNNVWDNDVSDPDYQYWDIFRMAKTYNPALETAIFSTWQDNRTKLIGDGLAEAGGHKLDYHFDGLELDNDRFPADNEGNYIREIDDLVAADAARVIRDTGPALSWVYLQHTDDVAHNHGDSPEFDAAVRLMDERVGLVWQSVLDRQAQYPEDWLIIVTTDHGRDAETGMEHGGQSERERTTWISTNSSQLNTHFQETPAIVDVLPSLATHLQLEIPPTIRAQLDGQTFID